MAIGWLPLGREGWVLSDAEAQPLPPRINDPVEASGGVAAVPLPQCPGVPCLTTLRGALTVA